MHLREQTFARRLSSALFLVQPYSVLGSLLFLTLRACVRSLYRCTHTVQHTQAHMVGPFSPLLFPNGAVRSARTALTTTPDTPPLRPDTKMPFSDWAVMFSKTRSRMVPGGAEASVPWLAGPGEGCERVHDVLEGKRFGQGRVVVNGARRCRGVGALARGA